MADDLNDKCSTVFDLKKMVEQFVGERDWHQFHSPKNLSMALAIEVGELMEHFQWITGEQSRTVHEDLEKKASIAEELSDVLCYCMAIANEMDIDIAQSMTRKMEKNRAKYPVEEYKGRYGPEDSGPEDGGPKDSGPADGGPTT